MMDSLCSYSSGGGGRDNYFQTFHDNEVPPFPNPVDLDLDLPWKLEEVLASVDLSNAGSSRPETRYSRGGPYRIL